MTHDRLARRDFLVDSARVVAAGWLALPWLASLAGCARDDARAGAAFRHLGVAEGRTLRAVAARILPSDDGTPGAEEAGAAHFVDRALGTPLFADALPTLRTGLVDLDHRAAALGVLGARGGFAGLDPARQDALLRAVERTPFFETVRTLVLAGTLADPSYGGNRDGVGWRLVGIDHRPAYQAPFGWYDARATAAEGAA